MWITILFFPQGLVFCNDAHISHQDLSIHFFFFLYKWPYLIDSKWCVSECYTCTIIKQGRAMFNSTDLSLHSSRAYWTTLLFSIHVLFLQQQIKIIMTVNSLGSYYIPDTVLSNLKVLPHLILTPRQWVASPSSHFTDRDKHLEVQGPACLTCLVKGWGSIWIEIIDSSVQVVRLLLKNGV